MEKEKKLLVSFASDLDPDKQIIEAAPKGTVARVRVGDAEISSFDASQDGAMEMRATFTTTLETVLRDAGYPKSANPDEINYVAVIALLFVLVLLVTMVYGPIAAALVELFPTRIRYTSMSLPYHIGNGWFGGFLPTVSFAIVAATGNVYSGLWYPVIIAAATFVIGLIFVPETKDRELHPDGE
jgi:hypothetical protein